MKLAPIINCQPLSELDFSEYDAIAIPIIKSEANVSLGNTKIVKAIEKHFKIEIDISEANDIYDVKSLIKSEIDKTGISPMENLFRITLKGKTGLKNIFINLSKLEKELSNNVFYIEIIDETSGFKDVKELAFEEGIKGDFVKRLLELIENEEDPKKKNILKRAMDFGISALENGSLEAESYR